jgi:hypothetical protein
MKLKLLLLPALMLLIISVQAQDLRWSLNKVTEDYFKMQKAFAAGNATMVTEGSQAFIWDARAIPVNSMTYEQHQQWFSHIDKLMAASRGISQGRSLDAQKQPYSDLSKQLFETLKLFHLNKSTTYKLSCGSYTWLNQSGTVSNPYVGKADKNKQCGNINDILKPGK